MASANGDSKSKAQQDLDFALGNSRVSLKDLSATEFDELLQTRLGEVHLQEIRGFTQLREMLPFRSDGIFSHGIKKIDLQITTTFEAMGFGTEFSVDLGTQVLELHGTMSGEVTFKRLETGEESSDQEVIHSWGHNGGYVCRGRGYRLAVCRPNKYSRASEGLIAVHFEIEKVPHKSEHVFTAIRVEYVELKKFRDYFGDNYARTANNIFQQVAAMHYRTAKELESQLKHMQGLEGKFQRLSDSLTGY
ncbi:MAG: hypothetical protein KBB55_04370 [Candidatus Buchananbacteria bacterium]|nr:hypothetical protein [Candidatus Buchananbacteria bacterium]